jgi:hypothetical protein
VQGLRLLRSRTGASSLATMDHQVSDFRWQTKWATCRVAHWGKPSHHYSAQFNHPAAQPAWRASPVCLWCL